MNSLVRYAVAPAEPPASSVPIASAAEGTEIAVIGLACRYPNASGPDEFWRLLIEKRDAVTEVPADRWSVDGRAGLTTRFGGFVDGIGDFDSAFFGLSDTESAELDPQQRLMLELSWEALEDAGIRPSSLRGTRSSVFAGVMWDEYARLSAGLGVPATSYTATGQDLSIIPARVAYLLGTRGAAAAINTACSSSLAAVHLARRALLAGECDLAIVGGLNVMLSVDTMLSMCGLGAMSPDGRCKSFDARADGYVRGEGGGAIVLKRLSRALAEGDPIRAVVLGSAMNNDGYSNGLTAPSPQAQEAVLADAYADAGVDPGQAAFVETHGTGTMLGDPIEAGALGAVLGQAPSRRDPLLLGSVKTNIGHLESAAGLAGLIKTVLALELRTVPPNLHFAEPNPHIPFDDLRLRVVTEPMDLGTQPVSAGVSSFGFGGTNVHVVLGSAPATSDLPPAGGAVRGSVFVFGGQGSQWAGMGRQLVTDPLCRAVLSECDALMRPHLGVSILDLVCDSRDEWLRQTPLVQPAIFALQVALAKWWNSRGVTPDAVVGQSMGEVAAAYIAGALSLADAVKVICVRSCLVGDAVTDGTMAVVGLPADRVAALIGKHHWDVVVAVVGSPVSTVVAGAPAAVADLVDTVIEQNGYAQRIEVDYASHCAAMDSLLPELIRRLDGIVPRTPRVPLMSTVTGALITGDTMGPAYWAKNLREPVQFGPVITALAEGGADCFLEVDPHPVLLRDIGNAAQASGRDCRVLPSMYRSEPPGPVLTESMAELVSGPGQEIAELQPLLISARSEQAVLQRASSIAGLLRDPRHPATVDLCRTAAVGRDHHRYRVAVTGRDAASLAASLDEAAVGVGPAADLVLLFPNLADPIDLSELVHREPVLWGALNADAPSPLREQVALARLWLSRGLRPTGIVGTGSGEVAAALLAEVLSLSDAARVAARNSDLPGLTPRIARIPLLNADGSVVVGPELDAGHWTRRRPVRPSDEIVACLRATRRCTVVMVGSDTAAPADVVQLTGTADAEATAAARLYAEGHDLDWAAFWPDGGRRVSLPRYPWQQRRLWSAAALAGFARQGAVPETGQPAAPASSAPLVFDRANRDLAALVRGCVSAVLPSSMTEDVPLHRLGLTSLGATEVRNRLLSELRVEVPLSRILRAESIADLATHIIGLGVVEPAATRHEEIEI